ncbi:thiolase family protein [Pseudomaricurvus alkylphenolicus]|uniref:thiolase family protein n=1 Tax=Pseudomaricurvus alkylphenolicus TaxID=1306991 RepID=UPI001424542C|nr:thiolase family protein [Pseudomaricurvus alkylphenolicus]NIB44914.1 thiolase family protein [Pseudomaricurvus alkylphenolicus]
MAEAYIIGAFSTTFGKKMDQSYKALTREAYAGVLRDAEMSDGQDIACSWFSNNTLYRNGQASIGGQVMFTPLVREGLFPEHVGMINVHNGCGSGSSAFRGAYLDVLSGQAPLSLAIGVEKMLDANRSAEETAEMFMGGIDRFDPEEWQVYYRAAGEQAQKPFVVPKDRSMFMDTYAMQAAWHMHRYGTTQHQLAIAAAKSHNFAAENERAQYRFTLTPEQVLEDREVSFPLTRAMCAPLGDGAAALLVASGEYLRHCPPSVQERAVRIGACEMSGGKYRALDEPGLTRYAAQRAFTRAGVTPADIDVAEVHDASSFSEIYQLEMLGFCPEGQGGRFIEEGRAHLGGDLPLNTSGGLVSKGHPVGATGVSMLCELVEQLRGEAGTRQVEGARLALAENGGGVIGFDEAVAFVTILERS